MNHKKIMSKSLNCENTQSSKQLKFGRAKNTGSTLLIAVILSAMILTIGIGAAKMLVKEVEFSADFLFSEKSYFAAESGIEIALLELKNRPVQNISSEVISIDTYTTTSLNLANDVNTFDFDLSPSESQKFRLLRDDKDDLAGYDTKVVSDFSITPTPAGKNFQWKVLCNTLSTPISTIHKIGTASAVITSFFTTSGFSTWTQPNKQTCFISIQNLSNTDVNFKFNSTATMTPHKSRVYAIGKAGSREKHISFDYYQKNLGALFDFVLFHTDQGL